MEVGRPRKFTTEGFKKAWENYFKWCDENPWYKYETIRGGERAGTIISIPLQRPYTEIGFCVYHGLAENYLRSLLRSLEGKEDIESRELRDILLSARAKCIAQKFEGAAVGVFNANIIARDLGLVDKQKHDVTADYRVVTNKPDLSKLSLEELKSLREINRKLAAG